MYVYGALYTVPYPVLCDCGDGFVGLSNCTVCPFSSSSSPSLYEFLLPLRSFGAYAAVAYCVAALWYLGRVLCAGVEAEVCSKRLGDEVRKVLDWYCEPQIMLPVAITLRAGVP